MVFLEYKKSNEMFLFNTTSFDFLVTDKMKTKLLLVLTSSYVRLCKTESPCESHSVELICSQ